MKEKLYILTESVRDFFEKERKRIVGVLVQLSSVVIGGVFFLILKNPFYLYLGIGGALVGTTAVLISLDKRQERVENELNVEFSDDPDQPYDSVNLESELKAEVFFELGEINPKPSLLDDKKLKLVGKKTPEARILNERQAISRIYSEVNLYYTRYNLPDMEISNDAFDILFYEAYDVFKNKRIEDKYYEAMSDVVRKTICNASSFGISEIRISTFMDCLSFLSPYGFEESEISLLRENIKKEINDNNKLNFVRKRKNNEAEQ